MEKLRIMLYFYTAEDFSKVVFHKLNSDQIIQFLKCTHFVGEKSIADSVKVIQALKQIQKSRELNLFSRPEITSAVKCLVLDRSKLTNMP